MRRREQLTANFFFTLLGVHPAYFPTRGHNAAQRTLGQGQHAVNHIAFFFRKRTFRYRHHRGVITIVCCSALFAAAHQTQNRIGGTRAQRQRRLVANKVTTRNLVKELDGNREANRGVQVALRYMETKTFRDQAQTDHQQEAQAEYHHCRMLVDEISQRLRGQQHHRHRNHHRRHHHRQMVNHPDRGNHGIQREHGVQYHDLQYDHPEAGITFTMTGVMLAVLQPFMKFSGRLKQQEYPAEQHDQVASGKREIGNAEKRFSERHHPRNDRQQTQAHKQRQRKADQARLIPLLWRQLVGKDGDKYQVVDTQYDFKDDKRQQTGPNRGIH